jgi:hypothetical protein
MTRACLTVAAACVVVGLAAPSIAGQVKLEIRGGLVTLDAKDATIREILAEWARVGKTQVANADTAPGDPLTLQFADVPERQALDTILRSVGGFLAIARTSPLDAGSVYDRIVVMAVARPAVGTATAVSRAGAQPQQMLPRDRIIIPPPVAADDNEDVQVAPMPGQNPYGGASQPGMPTFVQFGGVNAANPNLPQPNQTPTPPPAAQASPRPGMVTTPIIKAPGQPGEIK